MLDVELTGRFSVGIFINHQLMTTDMAGQTQNVDQFV